MTITKKTIISMIALGMAAVAPVMAQTMTVSRGDLLLSFYQDTGSGTYGTNTYVFNLGSAAAWRENTISLNLIANIGADLTTAFGQDWATDSTIRMGLIGGYTGTGDPLRTIYTSQGLTSFDPGSTSAPTLGGNRGTVANNEATYLDAVNGKPLNGGINGAIITSGTINSYTQSYLGAGNFGGSVNPNTAFTGSSIGIGTGGYEITAGLDLYRILNTTSGADLTAGLSSGNAAVGAGQYIGTFTLDADGNLRLDAPQAIPEPSTYALIAIALVAFVVFRRRQRTA